MGPSEEKWSTTGVSVPASSQCPREIDPPTPPPLVFRGAAVSSIFSQCPLCLRAPDIWLKKCPLRKLLCQPRPPGVSGHSDFQQVCSVSTRGHCSIKRLASSEEKKLSVWLIPTGHLLLPEMHQRPVSRNWFPRLLGRVATSAKSVSKGPADYRERVQNLIWFLSTSLQASSGAGARDRTCSSSTERLSFLIERGFYSLYFIVQKKYDGLRSILYVRVLNHTLGMYRFRMLML